MFRTGGIFLRRASTTAKHAPGAGVQEQFFRRQVGQPETSMTRRWTIFRHLLPFRRRKPSPQPPLDAMVRLLRGEEPVGKWDRKNEGANTSARG